MRCALVAFEKILSKIRHKHQKLYFSTPFKLFLTQEKDHFFLWIPVLLAVGIAFYFGITTELPTWIGLTCLFISGLTTYYLRDYYIVFLSTLSLTIIFVGFSSAQLRTLSVDTKVLPYSVGATQIQGRIAKIIPEEKGIKLILDNLQISRLRADHIPSRVRLHVNGSVSTLKAGQWIKTRAVLKPLPQPVSPHAFDFQRYAYFNGIGAIGFIYGELEILKDTEGGQYDLFAELRQSVQNRLTEFFHKPKDKNILSLATTFLTGSKGLINEETMENVRKAGLAHLLAISGLHIGLVCALFFFCIRFLLSLIPSLALRYPTKKWAAVFAIAATLCFTLLTGASVPTIRAFIMSTIVLVGVLLDRKAISLRSVAWAAIFILILFPESLMGASFQLSFAAVTALIAFYEHRKPNPNRPKIIGYISGIFSSSLIATCATTPFAAYHFNRVAIWGIGANLLAIPLTVFLIMPFGLAALILMPFHLEAFPLWIMGNGISALLWVANETAGLPFAQINISALNDLSLILLTLAGLCLCLLKSKIRFPAFAIASLIAFIITYNNKQPDILISGDGRISAIQTENGEVVVSQLRRAAYTRENWLRRWGKDENQLNSFEQQLACDRQGCLLRNRNGYQIIFNRQSMALGEDCQRADILITPQYSPAACTEPKIIIDRYSLKHNGAHAIHIATTGKIEIETSRDVRGQRPWTIYGNH